MYHSTLMFWKLLGGVASMIAIFAFVTGISNLSQLRRTWFNRVSASKPIKQPVRTSSVDGWSPVFVAPRYLFLILLCAVAMALLAYTVPPPHLPTWMPAVLSSETPSDRAWFCFFETLGYGHILLACLLRRAGSMPRDEFNMAMVLPLFLGAFGVLAIFADPIPGIATFLAFVGFGGVAPFAFDVVVETINAVYHFIARWRA
jgi:hypothetical protein